MVKTKVFVGNLAFRTHEDDLRREFEVAGKVTGANVITRGSRSLGYGFVEFDSEEEAQKAVQLLHHKSVDGREINVEVARLRDENAPREPRPPRPYRNNYGERRPQGQGQGQQQGQGQGNNDPNNNNGDRRPPRRFPNRRPPQYRNVEGGDAPRAPRPPRGPPRPRPEGAGPRVAGPHGLFVANLPFSVDDTKLSEIFAGLNLKSAHVVRKRNDRSKGFGFVEFNNADDQQKALAAVDKKSVDGRDLIVKIAIPIAQGGDQNAPKEGGAPAPAQAPVAQAPAAQSPQPAKAN